jgi:hypothetical protein
MNLPCTMTHTLSTVQLPVEWLGENDLSRRMRGHGIV